MIIMNSNRSAGSVAVVTGGSRGIGRATAERLAVDFSVVAIVFRSAGDDADAAADAIHAAGATPMLLQRDLADEQQAAAVVETVRAEHGRIDALVNNAGIATPAAFLDLTLEEWGRTFAVNLTCAFLLMQAAARSMVESGGGAIVNVGSPAGLDGSVTGAHYGASKAGLLGLTVSASKSLAPLGIRVNIVEPMYVETDMVRAVAASSSLPLIPSMGRRGSPKEVADVIAFLLSPAASYVSGARIAVSGAA